MMANEVPRGSPAARRLLTSKTDYLKERRESRILSFLQSKAWWLLAATAALGIAMTPSPWGGLGWWGWDAGTRAQVGGGLLSASVIGGIILLLEARQAAAEAISSSLRRRQEIEGIARLHISVLNDLLLLLPGVAVQPCYKALYGTESAEAVKTQLDLLSTLELVLFNSGHVLSSPVPGRQHDIYAMFMHMCRALLIENFDKITPEVHPPEKVQQPLIDAHDEISRLTNALLSNFEADEASRHMRLERELRRYLPSKAPHYPTWADQLGMFLINWLYPGFDWGWGAVGGRIDPMSDAPTPLSMSIDERNKLIENSIDWLIEQ